MTPNTQALQIFYGTVPFMAVVLWSAWQQRMLLQDILRRLLSMEGQVMSIAKQLGKIESRLVNLEVRAGVIYHDN